MALLLWRRHLSRIHISEEVAAESLFCSTALIWVQSQHVIKQVQGCRRNTKKQKGIKMTKAQQKPTERTVQCLM